MKNKLLLALAGVFATGSLPALAQTPAPATAPAYTLTATATYASTYMFRGQRLGGDSIQPAIELGSGSAVLGLWSTFPIDDVPDTSDPELDFYGSYTFTVSDQLTLAPGFTWYVYPNAPTNLGFYRSSFEPNIALNYTVGAVKLTPKLYYDFTLEGPTYELTGAYVIPLKDLGTELGFTAQIGAYHLRDIARDGSPKTKIWGEYWLVGVAAPFQITPKAKLTIGWAYTEGRDAFGKTGTSPKFVNTFAVGRGVGTISFSYAF
jgi:uncharacterized protein (TIGR02001 family)